MNITLNVLSAYGQEISALREEFSQAMKIDAPMAKYSSARVGGKADILIATTNAEELTKVIRRLWEYDMPFIILGGCSNVLVSDYGVREVVVLNRARGISGAIFDLQNDPPIIHAHSALGFGLLAREAAHRGLSGLEWATGIPGTLGGAIVGNAGAHGSDISNNLAMADILQRDENRQTQLPIVSKWSNRQFEFGYRSSILKKRRGEAILLSADLHMRIESPDVIHEKIRDFTAHRRKTQPRGASMGSMFKNPPDDYAGRLIEQAGLKRAQVGGAQISPLHANFFINLGEASASDIYQLIRLVQSRVAEKTGVNLVLEIQLIGDWH